MSTISSYGAAQESRVLTGTVKTYLERLIERGVTEDLLINFGNDTSDMETKRAAMGDTRSGKKQMTEDEGVDRTEVLDIIRRVQSGVKLVFPSGSPQWKEFHIGETPNNSTPKALGWVVDIENAFNKYKDALVAKTGLIPRDIDVLKAAAKKLSDTDTQQELKKKIEAPDATSAFQQALAKVIETADFIHNAAAIEFRKEEAILRQFASAKDLRYLPEPRKAKDPPPEPPTPQA